MTRLKATQHRDKVGPGAQRIEPRLSVLGLLIAVGLCTACVPAGDEVGMGSGGATGATGATGDGGMAVATGGASGRTGGSSATGGTLGSTGGRVGTGGGVPTCQTDAGGATGYSATTDPLSAAAKCSSGRTWSVGNGETMMPGDRCQGCHVWTAAGTVYPTGHEPTYCNGLSDTSVSIVITDSQCRVVTLMPNAAGNFYTKATLVGELAVKVIKGGTVRRMVKRAPHGECNACHTPEGIQGAPGRIVPPA